MNKKIFQAILILVSLLAVSLVIQPSISKVSAGNIFVFNRLGPSGDIYRGDYIIFGGTVFNNESVNTYIMTYLQVRIYSEKNITQDLKLIDDFSFASLVSRNTVEPKQSRTFSFEYKVTETWPIANNYSVNVYLYYRNIVNVGEETIIDNELEIGETQKVNVKLHREDAPNYIYGVFVILIIAILAFLVIGIVGWVRERRSKK